MVLNVLKNVFVSYFYREINISLFRNNQGPTSAVYRSKGVGEPPMVIASAGTVMAIRSAIAAYRMTSQEDGGKGTPWFSLNVPATCDKIRMASSPAAENGDDDGKRKAAAFEMGAR